MYLIRLDGIYLIVELIVTINIFINSRSIEGF